MTHWLIFVEFAALALVIGGSGYFLSLYGDVIAEKTGLGGTWVGIAMLATVTSLPELVTGVSAVTYVNVPNIALGDALGSCVFNLLLIVLLDFLHRGASVYTRISQGHILSAGFGVVLLGFVAFNLVLYQHGINLSFWHIGVYAPIIMLFYIFAMHTVFRYEKAQRLEVVEEIAERYPEIGLVKALIFCRRLLAMGLPMADIEQRYHMSRRIDAEEDTLTNADLVITSTRNEIEEQYELYDCYMRTRWRSFRREPISTCFILPLPPVPVKTLLLQKILRCPCMNRVSR